MFLCVFFSRIPQIPPLEVVIFRHKYLRGVEDVDVLLLPPHMDEEVEALAVQGRLDVVLGKKILI